MSISFKKREREKDRIEVKRTNHSNNRQFERCVQKTNKQTSIFSSSKANSTLLTRQEQQETKISLATVMLIKKKEKTKKYSNE